MLLFMEYRSFKKQTDKMLALQEDYRNHVLAINRVLEDHQISSKKKNESGIVESVVTFPKGARVYSSDDDSMDSSFIMVNRELEYLKQSSLEYLRKQKLNILLSRIDNSDWKDYTDQLLEKTTPAKKTRKKRAQRVRRSRVATYARDEASQTKEPQKRDILFAWPIKRSEFWISSFYGPRKFGSRRFHYGIDMAAVRGTPVYAAASGVVVEARYASGYGNTVVIAHSGKYRTRYAHLDRILTKVGRRVESGDIIGKVGATGSVRSSKRGRDASHLHFEVSVFGKQVNPMYFLVRDPQWHDDIRQQQILDDTVLTQ